MVPDKARIARAQDDAERDALTDDPKAFTATKGGIVDKWGHRPIATITRAEVIALLDEIVDRGAPVMANRVLAALRKLFNWSIERGLLETSPCDKVKPPTAERSRDRVLTDEEITALWHGAESMGWPFGKMFQVLLLTGQRREEVAGMAWSEMDLANKVWTLPRARVKTDKAHDVPLSDAVVAILERLPRLDGAGYVFTTNGRNPVSGFSKGKETLDGKMRAHLRKRAADIAGDATGVDMAPWRIHDIRRTVASGMAKLGISLAVIEKILNHTSGSFGGIVGVYQRHEFADEKRRALDAWAGYVMTLVSDEPGENVVRMKVAGQ